MTDQATPDRPTFVYEPDAEAGAFVMLIAKELTPTVDGRMFAADSVDWRELPIPLTLNRTNTAEGQHKTAVGIGTITEVWKDGSDIFGKGYFAADEEGQTARHLIKEGVIAHVSADVGGVTSQELSAEELAEGDYPDGVRKLLTKGTIIGVTALLHSSFNETKIAVDEDVILASAGSPWEPDATLFENPRLSSPTPLTVTADGHVFGHAALWGTCHVGYKDRCVTPPRSPSNYAYFSTAAVLAAGGQKRHVGRITANTGHAPMEFGAAPAVQHYDNTGFAAAYVATGEDEHGIWFSGSLAPDVTQAQIANLRAAGVSGDWRNIGGALEMVGLLAVNTPGFPIPRPAAGIVAGAQMSLVAAGMVAPEGDDEPAEDPAYSEGGASITVSDSEREQHLILFESDGEELASKKGCGKGKDCDCGCDDKVEVTESVDMEAEEADCGCDDPVDMIEFMLTEYQNGEPVNWATDLDQTFLASVGEQFAELSELAAQANDPGTPLSLQTQSFAAWLKLLADEQKNYVDRSLGRDSVEVEEEAEGGPSNEVPDSAYSVEEEDASVDLNVKLALLDADLIVFAVEEELMCSGKGKDKRKRKLRGGLSYV